MTTTSLPRELPTTVQIIDSKRFALLDEMHLFRDDYFYHRTKIEHKQVRRLRSSRLNDVWAFGVQLSTFGDRRFINVWRSGVRRSTIDVWRSTFHLRLAFDAFGVQRSAFDVRRSALLGSRTAVELGRRSFEAYLPGDYRYYTAYINT